MKCPSCNAWTFVLSTRSLAGGTKTRRYECANGHRITTEERAVRVDAAPRSAGRPKK